ncbi:MAG: D-Ala-D-Ala carboxypeptidase [Lysobacteraceae bacterium]|nr:MAG: D-Ala-D-Ala carboxypeptidase [Xanthomonadaceae bacterium]
MHSIVKLILALSLPLLSAAALAQTPIPAAPSIGARAHLLVDFDSGRVLSSENVDLALEPASITKLMTSYIVFDWLKTGSLSLDDEVTISEKAWRTEGSKMFIEVGKKIRLEDLLKGMIIQSGNDASVALAEHVAGSEDTFADLMNQYAVRLGMENSAFYNATGLPAEGHVTTAADLAKLAAAMIRDHPDYYTWYADKEFTFNGIRQHNRNTLLWRDATVDGMKTGHTEAAGYCLVSSAKRGNMRLISVVLGSDNEKSRADESQRLLNYGFRFFETHRVYGAGERIADSKVWQGEAESIDLAIADELYITIPRGQYERLDAQLNILDPLIAPIEADQVLGSLKVSLDGEVVAERDLVATAAVPEGGFWHRLGDGMELWFDGLFEE